MSRPINHPLKTKDNKEEVVVLSLCPEEIYCARPDKKPARVYVLFKERKRNTGIAVFPFVERKRALAINLHPLGIHI